MTSSLYDDSRRIDPFCEANKEIDALLAEPDSFTVVRLMQRYETAADKTAFVAALIGRVLLDCHRQRCAP